MHNIFILCVVIMLTGCGAAPTSKVAASNGFKQQFVQAAPFSLATYQKITKPGSDVNIYIEGDGRAWVTKSVLSKDPSPRASTVMQLAVVDPSPNVVYLARPCQFSPNDLKTVCKPKLWSQARYSPAVINALNSAINQIKKQAKCKKVNLIGYSGGGTLAVLIASKRKDVASIRTIAGNLDLQTMDKIHKTTPLRESIDPMNVAASVKNIPQIHFCGARDKVVPPIIARNFVKAANLNPKSIVVVKDASHDKNWSKHWPELLKRVP
jgi:hypothetical protein